MTTKQVRECEHCGADISNRHHRARFCFDCAEIKNNGGPLRKKLTCSHCANTISPHSTTGLCGYHRKKVNLNSLSVMAAAHKIVALAVKSKILPELDGTIPCHDCGRPAHEYDHRDYKKPLDVSPVCRACNKHRGRAKNHPMDEITRKYTGKPIKA